MLYGIIKNDRYLIWVTVFVLSSIGYFTTLVGQYHYYEYVLKSLVDLSVFFGPFFITGLITIIIFIKKKWNSKN